MSIHDAIDRIGLAVDAVGVAVIVVAVVLAGLNFARGIIPGCGQTFDTSYRQLRKSIGRGILLGPELLVAGDIIRTVAVAPNFSNVGVLALIVAIRTLLSFSLEVELTGQLPWQNRGAPDRRDPTPAEPI